MKRRRSRKEMEDDYDRLEKMGIWCLPDKDKVLRENLPMFLSLPEEKQLAFLLIKEKLRTHCKSVVAILRRMIEICETPMMKITDTSSPKGKFIYLRSCPIHGISVHGHVGRCLKCFNDSKKGKRLKNYKRRTLKEVEAAAVKKALADSERQMKKPSHFVDYRR